MKTNFNILIIFALLISISACKSDKANKEENKLQGTVKIDGSSTVYPVTEAVAEEFKSEFPDVQVTIGVSGTGGGFKKFGRGETDISNASRPIKEKEAADCEANNIKYIGLEVAYDGMAVVINPENDWATDIKVEELRKLWEPAAQGKILRWNQIRPEWPDKEIHLFGAGTASGTFDYFTEAIMGKSGASRGDYTASEDDNVLVQGIKNDPLALGFFGLAYYEENSSILKLVPVDNGNGPILPNMETVISNTYAPLSRPIYIYVNNVSTHRPEVVKFVEFYLETTKEIAKEVGYIQLPDKEIAEQITKFKKFVEENNKK